MYRAIRFYEAARWHWSVYINSESRTIWNAENPHEKHVNPMHLSDIGVWRTAFRKRIARLKCTAIHSFSSVYYDRSTASSNRALRRVRSSGVSFNSQHVLFPLKSSSSC
jgi:hypothetical protein